MLYRCFPHNRTRALLQAIALWRASVVGSAFWLRLSASPPPNALMIATCEPNMCVPLPTVFGSFLAQLEVRSLAHRHVCLVPKPPLPPSLTRCDSFALIPLL